MQTSRTSEIVLYAVLALAGGVLAATQYARGGTIRWLALIACAFGVIGLVRTLTRRRT
jgi:hypothetical protein